MKLMCKRAVVLLMLAAIMLGCFAGCGKNTDDPKGTVPPATGKPVIDEEVTITVLTQRHNGTTTDADDLWFFKYMEYWFAQQGYSVTIKVQQTNQASTQTSLLLGTDNLPDLVWGISLDRSNVIQYATEEKMILDWTPYLNEHLMPNLSKLLADSPEIMTEIVAPDKGLYALPYLTPAIAGSGCYGTSERLYFRKSWLDAAGKQNPTTQEELLDVLRAFKTLNKGTPLISDEDFLEKYLWTCLGFYGTEPNKYGSNLMINDGKLVIPAYTESYREFITFMNTLYKEGLISKDYLSMDSTTAQGLMRDAKCGALAYWTLEPVGNDFEDIVCANPILLGDNDEIHVSRLSTYTANTVWASSDTKYPELLAMMVDYIYSEEGAFIYRYGPKQGEDFLGLVDGWYYDENNDITTKLVADGTYASMSAYGRDRLFPFDAVGLRTALVSSGTGKDLEYKDSVTGETYTCLDNLLLDEKTNDGYWRLITIDAWSDYATSVRLRGVYLSTEDNEKISDIITNIQQYITSESAKFITGKRDLSEIDAFWSKLKDLGIETYLDIMTEAYSGFMNGIYGE